MNCETKHEGSPPEILKDPDLFNKVIKEFDKKIVGEEDSKKTIFLCSCGRLVDNAQSTSFHLMVNSESGAGKDHVVSNVLSIYPKEICIKRSRISPTAFTYWHNPKYEPEWTWAGKIFYNEDISTPVLNSDVVKVMASGGSQATIVINQKAEDIEIRGNPIMFFTTASANPGLELLRRFPIINLDESVDQTNEIKKRQAKLAVEGKKDEFNPKIVAALFHLRRVSVSIPYADKLVDIFPSNHVIIRTHFSRFLDYVKASCVFHQFQREKDEKGYLMATGQDYAIARQALLKITSNTHMIPLTRDQKRILEIFKKLDSGKLEKGRYSVTDLEAHISFITDRMLRNHLDKLTENGFLTKDKEDRSNSKKPVMVFSYVDLVDIDLPSWEELTEKYQIVSSHSTLSFNSNVSSLSNDSSNPASIETNETNEQRNQAQGGP